MQASDEARGVAFDILAAGRKSISAADLHERLTAWICWALGLPSATSPSHNVTAIVQGNVYAFHFTVQSLSQSILLSGFDVVGTSIPVAFSF